MANCEHLDFNEYFGKCFECGADHEQVIKENVIMELHSMYERMLEVMGIGGGFLDSEKYPEMVKAENNYATATAKFINHLYETEE
jgi:hypothetical protein